MKIIHFSDLHFGEFSELNNIPTYTHGEQFFSVLKEYLEDIGINQLDLVIFSGDITSKGENDGYNDLNFISFLDFLKNKKIPISFCPGNHERIQKFQENEKGFREYTQFLSENNQAFKLQLSSEFQTNQISYSYIEKWNSFFISMNSCIFSYLKIEKDPEDKRKNKNKLFIDDWGIYHPHLVQIEKEISKKYPEKYKISNKFLICHHALKDIKEREASIQKIERMGFSVIFSGHYHEKYYDYYNQILNLGAGSLLGNASALQDKKNYTYSQKQFNQYEINFENRNILTTVHKWDKMWSADKPFIKEIEIKIINSLDEWVKLIKLSPHQVEKLKSINIVFIEQTEIENQVKLIDNSLNEIMGYIIDENTTQNNIDGYREIIINNLSNEQSVEDIFFIVTNPDFHFLLPKQLVI